jgi:hypothetical protein
MESIKEILNASIEHKQKLIELQEILYPALISSLTPKFIDSLDIALESMTIII